MKRRHRYQILGWLLFGVGITAALTINWFASNAFVRYAAQQAAPPRYVPTKRAWSACGGTVYRMKVPGGWVLRDTRGMLFIEDRHHTWTVPDSWWK